MLFYECTNCGYDEKNQDYNFDFDYKYNNLYVICPRCGFREFITSFNKPKDNSKIVNFIVETTKSKPPEGNKVERSILETVKTLINITYENFEEVEKKMICYDEYEGYVQIRFDGLLHDMLNGNMEIGDCWEYRNKFDSLLEENNLKAEPVNYSIWNIYKNE